MIERRNLLTPILDDIRDFQKMTFIAGPRQVGKTTLLKLLAEKRPGPILNWDNLIDRKRIKQPGYEIFEEHRDVYLDEIHKLPRWKNFLKGAYDSFHERCHITVTGSARLDVYRRGGDSLLGRYQLYRLHPLSVGEVVSPKSLSTKPDTSAKALGTAPASKASREAWEQLERFGGFPEPFFRANERRYRTWSAQRHERLVREDIRDMTHIREIALLEHLAILLPPRVGNPLSLNSLREELDISHETIKTWISTLEEFYYLFTVPPYSKKIERALKKERKLFLWDWSEVEDPGAKFENMVASHILKWCHAWTDLGIARMELFYLRDKQKNEVDFLIEKDRKPWILIEAKRSDPAPAQALIRFSKQLGGLPVFQLIHNEGEHKSRKMDGIDWTLSSASQFFSGLP